MSYIAKRRSLSRRVVVRVLAAGTIVAIGIGGSIGHATTADAAAARKAVTVTMKTSKTGITAGNTVKITGKVVSKATKKPVRAAKVTVQQRAVGASKWRNVTTVKSSAKGRFSVTVKPVKSTYYRVKVAKSRTIKAAVTKRKLVKVTPQSTPAKLTTPTPTPSPPDTRTSEMKYIECYDGVMNSCLNGETDPGTPAPSYQQCEQRAVARCRS